MSRDWQQPVRKREFLLRVPDGFRDIRYHTCSHSALSHGFWVGEDENWNPLSSERAEYFSTVHNEWMVDTGYPGYLAFWEAAMISNLGNQGSWMMPPWVRWPDNFLCTVATPCSHLQPMRGLHWDLLTNERPALRLTDQWEASNVMVRDAMTITKICYSLANNSGSNRENLLRETFLSAHQFPAPTPSVGWSEHLKCHEKGPSSRKMSRVSAFLLGDEPGVWGASFLI